MKILMALVALATIAAPASIDARFRHHHYHAYHSSSGYYTARSGHRVHSPMQAAHAPRGASAKCGDGSWSFSENHRGTCSHHGGVARWL